MNKSLSPGREISILKIWHRRIGLGAAFFVLVLAISGFFLNHVSDWRLDYRSIASPVLLNWYGINKAQEFSSYAVGDSLVTRIGNELFVDTREIAHCEGALLGAVQHPLNKLIVIACNNELFVLDSDYELVERLGLAHGIPSSLWKIGLHEDRLVILANSRHYFADLEGLTWTPAGQVGPDDMDNQKQSIDNAVIWSEAIITPEPLAEVLQKHFIGEGITVERLLLDVHSGRIAGRWGVLLVDAMAGIFVILALSGFVMWLREPKRERQ